MRTAPAPAARRAAKERTRRPMRPGPVPRAIWRYVRRLDLGPWLADRAGRVRRGLVMAGALGAQVALAAAHTGQARMISEGRTPLREGAVWFAGTAVALLLARVAMGLTAAWTARVAFGGTGSARATLAVLWSVAPLAALPVYAVAYAAPAGSGWLEIPRALCWGWLAWQCTDHVHRVQGITRRKAFLACTLLLLGEFLLVAFTLPSG
ncbi:hypothetical protein G5C51_30440 [Streptomyces sp. A7024]|uniref:Yip1 domain-containing protein n=1 Tax=Streptomyces coryli TaxID=1128680 RepID=A0A6G4U927_9ACTN|nr:hypothetical protein [Streptomyces coryli]NGN68206.1 hypothetical protein [Streptomyces coryli]